MIDISPEEIISYPTSKLWNSIQSIKADEESKIDQDEYEKIKNGIKMKIPIWYITQEWYELYPSSKKMLVLGFGKFHLSDFMEEKDERDRMMRDILFDNLPEGVTQPRT